MKDSTEEKIKQELKNQSDIILTNRMHPDLNDVADKVFTRDCTGVDV